MCVQFNTASAQQNYRHSEMRINTLDSVHRGGLEARPQYFYVAGSPFIRQQWLGSCMVHVSFTFLFKFFGISLYFKNG